MRCDWAARIAPGDELETDVDVQSDHGILGVMARVRCPTCDRWVVVTRNGLDPANCCEWGLDFEIKGIARRIA